MRPALLLSRPARHLTSLPPTRRLASRAAAPASGPPSAAAPPTLSLALAASFALTLPSCARVAPDLPPAEPSPDRLRACEGNGVEASIAVLGSDIVLVRPDHTERTVWTFGRTLNRDDAYGSAQAWASGPDVLAGSAAIFSGDGESLGAEAVLIDRLGELLWGGFWSAAWSASVGFGADGSLVVGISAETGYETLIRHQDGTTVEIADAMPDGGTLTDGSLAVLRWDGVSLAGHAWADAETGLLTEFSRDERDPQRRGVTLRDRFAYTALDGLDPVLAVESPGADAVIVDFADLADPHPSAASGELLLVHESGSPVAAWALSLDNDAIYSVIDAMPEGRVPLAVPNDYCRAGTQVAADGSVVLAMHDGSTAAVYALDLPNAEAEAISPDFAPVQDMQVDRRGDSLLVSTSDWELNTTFCIEGPRLLGAAALGGTGIFAGEYGDLVELASFPSGPSGWPARLSPDGRCAAWNDWNVGGAFIAPFGGDTFRTEADGTVLFF
jgi:hypothetical protein